MTRFAGFAVLVVGFLLLVWGANASESASSAVSKFFTGAATNKTLYLIVGGAVAVIAGASMAWSPRRKPA